MKRVATLVLALMVAAVAWGAAVAEWEHVGRIVGTDGRPLTGEQTLEVRLYGSMTAKDVLWGRQSTAFLDADGNFSLRLCDALEPLDGSPTNSLESVLAAGPVFVEAKGAGGAMTPRAVVAAVPYALFAAGAEGADGDFDAAGDLTVHGKATVPTFRAKSADAAGNVDVAGTLTVEGDLTLDGDVEWGPDTGIGPMPVGTIVMWYGDGNSPPDGWVFCDGENGTPDLRGRFPVGAGKDYKPGDTGGVETVALTLDEMPAHSHVLGDNGLRLALEYDRPLGRDTYEHVWIMDISGATVPTDPAGGPEGGEEGSADPHENLPPFMALHYIMRVE